MSTPASDRPACSSTLNIRESASSSLEIDVPSFVVAVSEVPGAAATCSTKWPSRKSGRNAVFKCGTNTATAPRTTNATRKVAFGKLSQALAYGATTIQIQGDFDVAMRLVQEACAARGVYLLNSINPFRIEGQKTIPIEAMEQLGNALLN